MKLRKSCFGMDYEMETLIQALVIQINMVWNQFHGIIHELIGYALALVRLPSKPAHEPSNGPKLPVSDVCAVVL